MADWTTEKKLVYLTLRCISQILREKYPNAEDRVNTPLSVGELIELIAEVTGNTNTTK